MKKAGRGMSGCCCSPGNTGILIRVDAATLLATREFRFEWMLLLSWQHGNFDSSGRTECVRSDAFRERGSFTGMMMSERVDRRWKLDGLRQESYEKEGICWPIHTGGPAQGDIYSLAAAAHALQTLSSCVVGELMELIGACGARALNSCAKSACVGGSYQDP
eukprot:353268-Chlamydomonas_euryale.AAC.4